MVGLHRHVALHVGASTDDHSVWGGAETPVTVRFARPSTAEQRAWLLRTPLRLRGVHFNRQDRYAAKLLRLVRHTLPKSHHLLYRCRHVGAST